MTYSKSPGLTGAFVPMCESLVISDDPSSTNQTCKKTDELKEALSYSSSSVHFDFPVLFQFQIKPEKSVAVFAGHPIITQTHEPKGHFYNTTTIEEGALAGAFGVFKS